MIKKENPADSPPDYMNDPTLSEDERTELREFYTNTGAWTGGVYHPELDHELEPPAILPNYLEAASLSAAGLDAVRDFYRATGRWPDPCVLDPRPPAYVEDPRLLPGDLRDLEEFRAKTGTWLDPQFFEEMLTAREAENAPSPPPKRFNWRAFTVGLIIGRNLAR